jgi:transcriptional regulator with XRE-family HTH domain
MSIAERIRKARKLARMSQKKLGSAIGVTPQQVQLYEYGKNSPGADKVARLATGLQVTTDWLLTGRGPMKHSAPLPLQVRPGDLPDPSTINRAVVLHRLLVKLGTLNLGDQAVMEALVNRLLPGSVLAGVEAAEEEWLNTNPPSRDGPPVLDRIRRLWIDPLPLSTRHGAAGDQSHDVYDGDAEPGQVMRVPAEDLGAVIVRGDSAEPFARDGQAVLVDLTSPEVRVGDLCLVVSPADTVHLKRKKGSRHYESINPEHKDFICDANAEYKVVGVLTVHEIHDTVETSKDSAAPSVSSSKRRKK